MAKDRNERTKQRFDPTSDPHCTRLYQHIRGDRVSRTTTLLRSNNTYTSNIPEIIDEIKGAWQTVYNRHANNPPDFSVFKAKYQSYYHKFHPAPTNLPTAEDLFRQAQCAKPRVSAGRDGWLPVELKALPMNAWSQRKKCLTLRST